MWLRHFHHTLFKTKTKVTFIKLLWMLSHSRLSDFAYKMQFPINVGISHQWVKHFPNFKLLCWSCNVFVSILCPSKMKWEQEIGSHDYDRQVLTSWRRLRWGTRCGLSWRRWLCTDFMATWEIPSSGMLPLASPSYTMPKLPLPSSRMISSLSRGNSHSSATYTDTWRKINLILMITAWLHYSFSMTLEITWNCHLLYSHLVD